MKIESCENYINLEVQLETDDALPNYGDAHIVIVVSSNGYNGQNQIWVTKEELDLFSVSIQELEKSRKGEAILSSMSPDELSLRVFAYDGLGHMAVEGKIGHQFIDSVYFNHSIQFGFTIEPDQLVKLSKVKWLNHKNA